MTLSPASSRGVPPTFECIRFPITFDTPGLVPKSFPITALDTGAYPITAVDTGGAGDGSFTIAGDHAAAFPVDSTFTVTGSTGNDGPYTVVATSVAAGHTTIEVLGSLNDATPDGSVVSAIQTLTVAGNRTAAFAAGVGFVIVGSTGNDQAATVLAVSLVGGNTVIRGSFVIYDPTVDGDAVVAVGATVYTPAVGDILLGNNAVPLVLATVSEAWNGTSPNMRVLTESYRQAQAQFSTQDATVEDQDGQLALCAPPGFAMGNTWRLWRFTTADPILVQVDNNGLDPGSTQGAGEIVLLLIPAA